VSCLPGLTCKSWGSYEGKGSAICSLERATAPARAVKGLEAWVTKSAMPHPVEAWLSKHGVSL
jgi:hypothetical protein